MLRRLTAAHLDSHGFIALSPVMAELRAALGTVNGTSLGAWTDTVVGRAIEAGSIEVHAWAPGQPRHGRGLFGDRCRPARMSMPERCTPDARNRVQVHAPFRVFEFHTPPRFRRNGARQR